MKLTVAQQKIVDKAKKLEQEHGHGNVFLRYINDYWNVMFVIHKHGDDKITLTQLADKNKINGRIINSLQEKGLLQMMDQNHNILTDSNNSSLVGSRIVTENI